jgi:hypothetical protein
MHAPLVYDDVKQYGFKEYDAEMYRRDFIASRLVLMCMFRNGPSPHLMLRRLVLFCECEQLRPVEC